MIDMLIRMFVKDSEHTESPEVRGRYGVLAGGVGIALNLLLCAAKFVAGLLTSSIAVTADAFNNLSDAGSSLMTLVGFKIAGMPPDSQHPFGHGRVEYLSGLGISMAIMLVGIELGKSSITKIITPQAISFSAVSVGILVVSIAIKLWMAWFNRSLSVRIGSAAMRATAMDSVTDSVATAAVLLGVGVGAIWNVNIDGWVGLIVAAFILYTGFSTARDSLSPLLGQAPDHALVQDIADTVLTYDGVTGIHDLIIHDYGPGRRIVSLHAEVSCEEDILVIHDMIDEIELELRQKFRCDVTIHMDPISQSSEEVTALKAKVVEMVLGIDPELSIHDFRVVIGTTHTNLIFDMVVPYKFRLTDAEVAERGRAGVHAIDSCYFGVIRVERAFT